MFERFAAKYFAWLCLAAAAGAALLSARASRGGSFRDDDLVNIGYSIDTGFSLDSWLGPAEFREHLVPLAKLLTKLLAAVGPQWWIAQLYGAAVVALLVVLVAMAVRLITDSAVAAIAVGALTGSSIVVISIAQWWTSATLNLPMLCCSLLALVFALHWSRSRSWWMFGLAVLAQIAACAFSARATLVPLLIWFVVALQLSDGGAFNRVAAWRAIRGSAPIGLALCAVVGLQVLLTLLLASREIGPGLGGALHAGSAVWFDVVRYWWQIGVAGTTLNSFGDVLPIANAAQITGGGVIALSFLGVVAGLTIRGARSALAWAVLVILVTLSGVQIAAARVVSLGAQSIAAVPRYQDLTVLLLAVLIPAAWAASGRPWPKRPFVSGLLAAVCVGFFGIWLVNLRSDVLGNLSHSLSAANYARNMRSSLQRWAQDPRLQTLLDQRIPGYVVFQVPHTQDYNFASRAVQVFAPGVRVPPINSTLGKALKFDDGGVLRQVRTARMVSLQPTAAPCGSASRTAAWATPGGYLIPAHIPRAVTASGRPILLRVSLTKSSPAGFVGVLVVGEWPLYSLPLADYARGFRVLLPAGATDIQLQLWQGASTCVDSIKVGAITSR